MKAILSRLREIGFVQLPDESSWSYAYQMEGVPIGSHGTLHQWTLFIQCRGDTIRWLFRVTAYRERKQKKPRYTHENIFELHDDDDNDRGQSCYRHGEESASSPGKLLALLDSFETTIKPDPRTTVEAVKKIMNTPQPVQLALF